MENQPSQPQQPQQPEQPQPAQSSQPQPPPHWYPPQAYGQQPYGQAHAQGGLYGQPRPRPVPVWKAALAGGLAGGVLTAAIAVPGGFVAHALLTQGGTSSASGQGGSSQASGPFGQLDPGGATGDGNPWTGQQGGGTAGASQSDAVASDGVLLVNTQLSGGGEGAGTAMALTSDGLALTNYHVVDGSDQVTVTDPATGTTYPATVLGHDQTADVALLQLQGARDLKTVTLDEDGDATTGAPVASIGNAGGQGYLSEVTGRVVGTDKAITTQPEGFSLSDQGNKLSDLIETNARVVPGYSGGPTLDSQGEVVGITSAASSTNEQGGPAQAYVVPIDKAMKIVDQIKAGDETAQVRVGPNAYLGVGVSGQRAQVDGAPISTVEADGAAADAGITAGSVVTRIGDDDISSAAALVDAIATHQPGDRVAVAWTDAAGQQHTGDVTLTASPVN